MNVDKVSLQSQFARAPQTTLYYSHHKHILLFYENTQVSTKIPDRLLEIWSSSVSSSCPIHKSPLHIYRCALLHENKCTYTHWHIRVWLHLSQLPLVSTEVDSHLRTALSNFIIVPYLNLNLTQSSFLKSEGCACVCCWLCVFFVYVEVFVKRMTPMYSCLCCTTIYSNLKFL